MNELRMGFKQAILQRMQTFESSSTINSKSRTGSPGLPRTTTSVSPPTMQPAQITDFSINRILGEVPKVMATNKKSTPHVASPKCTNTLNDSILDLSKTSTSDIPPTAAAPYSATYAAFHQDFLAAAAAANATKFYAQFFPHIFPSAAYPYPHPVTSKRYFAPYVLSTATRSAYRYPATAATNLPPSTVTSPSSADVLVRPKVCPRDCTDCVVYYNQFSSKTPHLNYGTAVNSATSGSISPYLKTKCASGELSLDDSAINSSVISSKSIRNMSGKISKLHLQVVDKSPSASPQSAVFNAEEISYKCRICDKVFGCSQTLQAHERTHKSPRYECTDCGKGFSQLRNYKYHLSVHRGTKEFAAECPECGKTFNDKGYLSSHMKIHRNKKEYECPYCPKSFNQRVAFNMHVRIHTGVKPHKCVECGKRFSRKMLLKQHMRTHSGEKPYQCSVCGKSFADRSNMTLHHRLHSGIKPFNCPICPKAFTKKHHLKTHLNYHTGCKPYVCPHPNCNQAFTQSSNMRTHAKKCQYRPLQLVFPASSTSTMDGKTTAAAAAAAAITTTATMANNFTALCLPHISTTSSSSSTSSSALSAGIRMFSSSSFNAVQTQLPPAQQQLMASLRPF